MCCGYIFVVILQFCEFFRIFLAFDIMSLLYVAQVLISFVDLKVCFQISLNFILYQPHGTGWHDMGQMADRQHHQKKGKKAKSFSSVFVITNL